MTRSPKVKKAKSVFPEFVAPLTPANLPADRCAVPRETASRRILVTRTGANGDILMGTPLLAALREQWPNAHLTWMVERREREAIDANPHVDEILLWDSKYWKQMTRRGLYPLWAIRAWRLHQLMMEKRFDTFVSFQPEDWPTLVRSLKMGGATERIGIFDTFREYHRVNHTSRRSRLFSTVFPYETHPPHRVEQYLLPLQALGLQAPRSKKLVMGYTNADETDVSGYIQNELNNKPFIVVAPLTGWPSRVWPLERFAKVSDNLARDGYEIVLVSGPAPKDCAHLEAIAAQMQTVPHLATGRFGFRALAALIARAALVVSGDTGPMHLASALDTPYVALFGPSPVERFAPLVGRGLPLLQPVPCGPCHQLKCRHEGENHQLCMKRLSVGEVTDAARSLLAPERSVTPANEASRVAAPPPVAFAPAGYTA